MPTAETLLIRPISPDHKQQFVETFERLSDRSRYRRFLSARRRLSTADVRYLTQVDHHDHEAFVAIDPESGTGVGVARTTAAIPPRPCERASAAAQIRRARSSSSSRTNSHRSRIALSSTVGPNMLNHFAKTLEQPCPNSSTSQH